MIRRPPRSPLFPYTPLFRSIFDLAPQLFPPALEPSLPVRPPPVVELETHDLPPPGWADQPPALPVFEISPALPRSEEHTSELQSPCNLVCRLLLEKKKEHGIDEARRRRTTRRDRTGRAFRHCPGEAGHRVGVPLHGGDRHAEWRPRRLRSAPRGGG